MPDLAEIAQQALNEAAALIEQMESAWVATVVSDRARKWLRDYGFSDEADEAGPSEAVLPVTYRERDIYQNGFNAGVANLVDKGWREPSVDHSSASDGESSAT